MKFNCHDLLNQFYEDEVRIGDGIEELKKFRNLNVERLKVGIKTLQENQVSGIGPAIENFDQGSMAMKTLNESQHGEDQDLDHAIVFNSDDLKDGGALQTRNRVESALREGCAGIAFNRPPEARTNAVTVWYEDGYHIDFAVYKRVVDGSGCSSYFHAGPTWTPRDPRAITNWFSDANESYNKQLDQDSKDQFRRVVRLIKFWSRSRIGWDSIGGLVLSVLVDEVYQPNSQRDDVVFKNVISNLLLRLDLSLDVLNPTDKSLSLTPNEAHKHSVEVLKGRLAACKDQLDDLAERSTEQEVRKVWRKIFANDWWIPEERDRVASAQRKVSVTYELEGRRYQYDPLSTAYIPSGAKINFQLDQPLNPGESVKWIVKNDGDEATLAGDIRERPGKLNPTYDGCVENAKYKGEHEMKCVIFSSNQTLAAISIPVRVRHSPVLLKYWNQFSGGKRRRRRPF